MALYDPFNEKVREREIDQGENFVNELTW